MEIFDNIIPHQSLSRSIFYHLLPGICILLFYVLVTPYLTNAGYSATMGVLLGFILVGIPSQLFIMFKEGKQQSGKYTLKNVLSYTQQIAYWHYILYLIGFILYAGVVVYAIGPIGQFLKDSAFSFLPSWSTNNASFISDNASGSVVVISFLALFLIDGIINPIVEEVYFRGYLMPRISRFGIWCPVLNAALFALAHFWQPWNVLQIFILVAPLYIIVWLKKSIYISILVHCTANLLGALAILGVYLSQS